MRSRTLLLTLLAGAAIALGPGAAGAIEMHTFGKRFCGGQTLHDYGAILDRMPPVRMPPASGQLPFGPRNLSLYSAAMSRVIVGKGGYGYGFFDETYSGRTLRLNWEVTVRLSLIGRAGNVRRTIRAKTGYLGVVPDIGERSFWLATPGRPALYRFDIEFRDGESGPLLGAYSEYIRVVRPTYHARIAVDRDSFLPGQRAFARVENRGTEYLSFGLDYEVQRFDSGRWIRAPGGPSGVWPAIGIVMGGGASGWCMPYRVPADAPPGRYRFVKGLGSLAGHHGGTDTAAFRVSRTRAPRRRS